MRPSGGADKRVGDAPALEVAAEIDEHQPVVAALAEIAQRESLRAEHRPVEPSLTRPGEGRVLAPQAQEVAVERDRVGVALGFAPVELAALEAVAGFRIGKPPLHLRRRDAWKLAHEGVPAVANEPRQLRLVIGEIEERRRRLELLALEQHRRRKASAGRAPSAPGRGRGSSAGAAARRVPSSRPGRGSAGRRRTRRGGRSRPGVPRRLLLPGVALALEQEAVLRRGDELLRRALVVLVIGLVAPGRRDRRASGGSRRSRARRGRSRRCSGGRRSFACCGSFSPTTTIDRPPAAARRARAIMRR